MPLPKDYQSCGTVSRFPDSPKVSKSRQCPEVGHRFGALDGGLTDLRIPHRETPFHIVNSWNRLFGARLRPWFERLIWCCVRFAVPGGAVENWQSYPPTPFLWAWCCASPVSLALGLAFALGALLSLVIGPGRLFLRSLPGRRR